MDKGKFLKEYGLITVGIFIISAAVYFFMIPSNVIVGSLSGLVIVLENFIPIPISVMTFILNAALLVVGFLVIGKEFGAKTIYTSVMLPVFLFVFEHVAPNNKSLTNDILLDTITYILIVSVGLAMLFNANASSGGLDIVAKVLSKFTHIENGIVIDNFISGFNRRKRVCILTSRFEEVQKFIAEKLGRGVTLYKAIGGYDRKEQFEIQTILTQSEYGKLLEYMHENDMKAFVTVSTVNEVIGEWNIKKKGK